MTMRTKAALLIFLVSIIIYSNSLGGEFVYDDQYFIVKNINIRNLENLFSFFTNPAAVAFAELAEDVYRPITTASYAIDYFLWKLDTFGYHLTNVLFHSFNAILLFIFLYAVFADLFFALVASLLFVSHPVQTEVVSWISGRASVLFLFFYLSSLIFYVSFLKESKKRYLLCSLASYAVSLFSKEMAVTLPLVLIAYDIHFFNKDVFRKKVYRYAPYFALTLFFVSARYFVLKRVSQCGWWGGSPYYTFLTMSKVMVEYVKLLFLPIKLCAFYVVDISTSIAKMPVLSSLIILALLVISLPLVFRYSRRASFSIWWFFITFLPALNIVPLKALMAERFLYIPSIGFCMALAIVMKKIGKKTVIAACLAGLIILLYSVRTIARNEDWKDCTAISKSIINVSPLNPWAYTSLGTSYLDKGRHDEAIKAFKKAISLSRDYASPRNALGFCYLEMGQYEDAVKFLADALRLKPGNLETMNSLGVAYASLKRYDEAIDQFNASIKADPTYVNAYLNLGTAYEKTSEYDKALASYNKIALNTKSVQEIAISYIRIGDVYMKKNMKDEARRYYKKAVETSGRGMEELKKVAEDRLRIFKSQASNSK